MMILILLTMNTTREDKTRRTNATTEKTEKATLSWQRERFAKVSVFFFVFCVERVRFLLDLRLFLSWCYECVGGLKM